MKKLFILLLSLILVFCLFSCGGSTECTNHTDANSDGKCDECGSAVENPDTPCTEHIDTDGNGKCDNCNETVKVECTEHTDTNSDGKCDTCGETLENEESSITLIKNQTAAFRFVLSNDLTDAQNELFTSYVTSLRSKGIYPEVVYDSTLNIDLCEVLIGEVTGRGAKYAYDRYSLGKEGYAVTSIEEKVIVTGGSDKSLELAIVIFFEDILGVYLDSEEPICDASLTEDNKMVEIQDNYNVSDIKIAGESIKGRTIAVDTENELYYEMALFVQDSFYTAIGAYLPIVSLDSAEDDSVVIKKVADDGEFGFKIFTSEKNLNIECAFDNKFENTLSEFITHNIKLQTGEISFGTDFLYTKEIRIVTYEEFGAKGDGRADDFFAMKAAHDFANEGGQTVVGKAGRTYRIHNIVDSDGKANSIKIKTDVIWEGVKFIIDDKDFTHSQKNNGVIFYVQSDYSAKTITNKTTLKKIFSDSLTVEEGFDGYLNWSDYGYEAMIVVNNADHYQYIRYGYNTPGSQQKELIVVGADGKIDESTPFMWDYNNITSITIYRMDTPITIKGGEITHIASNMPQTKDDGVAYFTRRMTISRSNTTIDGLKHLITGELPGTKEVDGPKGPPYSGFIYPINCANITIKNVVLTGRKYSGLHGTYDFQASTVNNLYLYNVTQSNYYKEDGVTPTMDYKNYWGIGGTSYCKNMVYDTCLLSRYDAHEGLYNGAVINSTVCNMELIGKGEMLIENTTFTPISNTPIMLRSDYGCTWRGTITVKDCTIKSAVAKDAKLLATGWYNFYFGYVCYMPNIVIDNVHWENLSTNEVFLCSYAPNDLVHKKTLSDGSVNVNPYTPPDYIKVINNNDGIVYKMYWAPFYENTRFEGVELLTE